MYIIICIEYKYIKINVMNIKKISKKKIKKYYLNNTFSINYLFHQHLVGEF